MTDSPEERLARKELCLTCEFNNGVFAHSGMGRPLKLKGAPTRKCFYLLTPITTAGEKCPFF